MFFIWLLGLALAAPRLVVEPEDGLKPLLDLIASARIFAVADPKDLPHLVLAFERLDAKGQSP